jgi:hypothetical protein
LRYDQFSHISSRCRNSALSFAAGGIDAFLTKRATDRDSRRVLHEAEAKAAIATAPSSRVIGFLNAQNIEHSGYLGEQRKIYAIVRNSSAGKLVHGAVQIEFDFDPDQALTEYIVREVFTGP